MKKTLRVGVAASQARFDLEHRPSRYQRNSASNRFRLARSITTPPYARRTSTCVLPGRPPLFPSTP